MKTGTSMRLTYVLVGTIVICLAGLAWQHAQIRTLRLEVSESLVVAERAASDAAAMRVILASQEARIDSLEATRQAVSGLLKLPLAEELELLQPGIYVLETSTPFDLAAEETTSYEITHVVVEIRYEDYGTKLHIGVAKSGWIPDGVYFDYDNDGRIDTDMAFEFVRDIPIVGRRLAKAYGPDLAQNLYSIFVSEAKDARYTSVDDLNEDAEAASSYVWTFLMDYYEAIEAWVVERLQQEQSEQDGQGMKSPKM